MTAAGHLLASRRSWAAPSGVRKCDTANGPYTGITNTALAFIFHINLFSGRHMHKEKQTGCIRLDWKSAHFTIQVGEPYMFSAPAPCWETNPLPPVASRTGAPTQSAFILSWLAFEAAVTMDYIRETMRWEDVAINMKTKQIWHSALQHLRM